MFQPPAASGRRSMCQLAAPRTKPRDSYRPLATSNRSDTITSVRSFRRSGFEGAGIRNDCRRFVALCGDLKLFSPAVVAIDSSKSEGDNSRGRNFTPGKIDRHQEQIEQSVQRYLDALG